VGEKIALKLIRPEAERKTEAGQMFFAQALYAAGRWDYQPFKELLRPKG
jgi:hypothetical protein